MTRREIEERIAVLTVRVKELESYHIAGKPGERTLADCQRISDDKQEIAQLNVRLKYMGQEAGIGPHGEHLPPAFQE